MNFWRTIIFFRFAASATKKVWKLSSKIIRSANCRTGAVVLLAIKWDRIIPRQTGGAKSLDDVMRDSFRDAKTKKFRKLSKEQIVGNFEKYAQHNFAGDVEKYIERGETIGGFRGAAGECLETAEQI